MYSNISFLGDQVSVVDLGIHLIGYPGVGPAGNQDYYEKYVSCTRYLAG